MCTGYEHVSIYQQMASNVTGPVLVFACIALGMSVMEYCRSFNY